jgi:mRNA export factor
MAGLFGGPANPLTAQPTLSDIPDVDLVSPPPESISTIAFSPVADHLAVGSWGPDVRPFDSRRVGLIFCRKCVDVRF